MELEPGVEAEVFSGATLPPVAGGISGESPGATLRREEVNINFPDNF